MEEKDYSYITNRNFIRPELRYVQSRGNGFVSPDQRPVADIFPENMVGSRRVIKIATGCETFANGDIWPVK